MFKPIKLDEYEFVSDDHLLRLIDKYIDFSFLLEKVRPFYCDDNNRPSKTHHSFLDDVHWLSAGHSLRETTRKGNINEHSLQLVLRIDPVSQHSTIVRIINTVLKMLISFRRFLMKLSPGNES